MPDPNDFTRLVRDNHRGLRYFILRLGVNPSWVDDVAQDVFLIAYRKWDEMDTVENPGGWLRAIARNVVMNENAKFNRRQRLFDENLTTLLLAAEGAPAADERADIQVDRAALSRCLDRLSERAREVVHARYFNDLSSGEIGDKLDLSSSAVRKILFHARQNLARCLRGKEVRPA